MKSVKRESAKVADSDLDPFSMFLMAPKDEEDFLPAKPSNVGKIVNSLKKEEPLTTPKLSNYDKLKLKGSLDSTKAPVVPTNTAKVPTIPEEPLTTPNFDKLKLSRSSGQHSPMASKKPPVPVSEPREPVVAPPVAPLTSHPTPLYTCPPVVEEADDVVPEEAELVLLTGEQKLISLSDAFIQVGPGKRMSGTLYMTTFRLHFAPSSFHRKSLASTNPCLYSYLNIPLACIERIDKDKQPKDAKHTGFSIVIHCKDFRLLRITLQAVTYSEPSSARAPSGDRLEKSAADIERAFTVMDAYAFPNNINYSFAFNHNLTSTGMHFNPSTDPDFAAIPHSLPRVVQYDVVTEFIRQGVLSNSNADSMWKLTDANKNYGICDTYPKLLFVPRNMSEHDMLVVSNFRSGHRLPTLCWGDGNGATIWRSSQPKAGLSTSCAQDERFLEYLAQSCVSKVSPLGVRRRVANAELFIVDCRPRASAMANRAAGAGYEVNTNYPNSRLEFFNIGNIHCMRDSMKSLFGVMSNPQANPHSDVTFSKQVEDTQWLSHVRYVIRASWDTAVSITKGVPVLVHCSHGWDRTAQVCGLAQLFLDPYYRTIQGFQMLVEKEFISFGHPFLLRCAHGQDKANRQEDQMSPIFMQFLDCVWQVARQFPCYFEFNLRYILALADQVYAGRFGTFLFNSDKERDMAGSREKCVDVWTYLHYNRRILTNSLYMDPNDEDTPTTYILLPPLSQLLRNVCLWSDFFCRWSSVPTIVHPPTGIHSSLIMGNRGICRSPNFSTLQHLPHIGSCVDLEIPFMSTINDFWEATYVYHREQHGSTPLEEEVDVQDGVSESNGETDEVGMVRTSVSAAVRRQSKAGRRESRKTAGDTQFKDAQTIARLVQCLQDKGVSEEEVCALLSDEAEGLPPSMSDEAELPSIIVQEDNERENTDGRVTPTVRGEGDKVEDDQKMSPARAPSPSRIFLETSETANGEPRTLASLSKLDSFTGHGQEYFEQQQGLSSTRNEDVDVDSGVDVDVDSGAVYV